MNRQDVLAQGFPGWEVESIDEKARVKYQRVKDDRCNRGPARMLQSWESQEFQVFLRHQVEWGRVMIVDFVVSDGRLVATNKVIGFEDVRRKCGSDMSPTELFMESLGFDV